jgi:uroporphyrin-III C-methyltransferase / precorrin-2 dehydrogenase / sirohydrochlorin ferrochelatase
MQARRPYLQQEARIAPLASLPLFHQLEGKKLVLIGNGQAVKWKAELLAATGAHVFWYQGCAFEQAEVAHVPAELGENTYIHSRVWCQQDLQHACFVVADAQDEAEALALQAAARAHNVPLNIIDKPAYCDFQFGSIVNRSPLVIGISTNGVAPALGQLIRGQMETLLPHGISAWLEAARTWRPWLKAHEPQFARRRQFWGRFAAFALQHALRAPSLADRDALVAQAHDALVSPLSGRVALVGAGAGDPELLTIKALRALQNADVILYDDLVSAEILDYARREAERISVGKKGHGASCRQEDINKLMVQLAAQGKYVVRLKGGDPSIFGRAGEELAACAKAHIPVQIIPGISAAQAAAADLGISLTDRDCAQRLQFVTGHAQTGGVSELDWPALASAHTSTAVYMPRRTLRDFVAKALEAGLAANTPAVAVRNASRADVQQIFAPIAELAHALEREETDTHAPLLVLIGAVVANAKGYAVATEPPALKYAA